MAPMKKKIEKEGGKKKEMITVEVKKKIIEMHQGGMRVVDLARFYNKSTSTISTILKKKEVIRGLNAAKGVTKITKQRPRVLEDVEKLLLVWINEKQLAGHTLTQNFICEKAKALYANLVSKLPSTSTENVSFKASRGWLENFKKRSGIYCVVRHGEDASSDNAEFQKLNMWSDFDLGPNFEECTHEQKPPVVVEIVSLGKTMKMEVNEDDIQELEEDHSQELINDEQQEEIKEEISWEEEEKKIEEFLPSKNIKKMCEKEEEKIIEESLNSNEIREMCKMWETLQNFVEQHHPNKALAIRAMNVFNDNAMSHFREILKRKQNQV